MAHMIAGDWAGLKAPFTPLVIGRGIGIGLEAHAAGIDGLAATRKLLDDQLEPERHAGKRDEVEVSRHVGRLVIVRIPEDGSIRDHDCPVVELPESPMVGPADARDLRR